MVIVALAAKLVPVIVTAVPPVVIPVDGVIAVTVGAGVGGVGLLGLLDFPPQPTSRNASEIAATFGHAPGFARIALPSTVARKCPTRARVQGGAARWATM